MNQPLYKRMDAICDEVAAKHHVQARCIRGPRRYGDYVQARQEAAWRIRMETQASYPTIARYLGGRHHTTIMTAVMRYWVRAMEATL